MSDTYLISIDCYHCDGTGLVASDYFPDEYVDCPECDGDAHRVIPIRDATQEQITAELEDRKDERDGLVKQLESVNRKIAELEGALQKGEAA